MRGLADFAMTEGPISLVHGWAKSFLNLPSR